MNEKSKPKQKFGIVPPCQFRFANGRKYRAGDRYPLPLEEVKPKTSIGGGTHGSRSAE